MAAALAALLLVLATPPELEARDFKPFRVTSYTSEWPDPDHPGRHLHVETLYPVARWQNGFPLVLLLGSDFRLDDQTDYWASRGFVVERLDDWQESPAEVSYLLDQLAKLATPKSPLEGMIDWSQVAVVGDSLAAAEAVGLAVKPPGQSRILGRDPRIKAAIVSDRSFLQWADPTACQGITVPVLWLGAFDPREPSPKPNPCFDAPGTRDQYRVDVDRWVSLDFQDDWIRAETTAFLRARLADNPRARTWLDSKVIELQTDQGMRVYLK